MRVSAEFQLQLPKIFIIREIPHPNLLRQELQILHMHFEGAFVFYTGVLMLRARPPLHFRAVTVWVPGGPGAPPPLHSQPQLRALSAGP